MACSGCGFLHRPVILLPSAIRERPPIRLKERTRMGGLRILSWNVNGLRAAHRKGFLDWFANESPDVLCLQETKISEDQLSPNFRQVEGYDSYFSCAERKGYSGVGIFSKVPPVHVESSFNVDALSNEGRVLLADYGRFVLLNVYFPNGRSSAERLQYKMDFYDAFLELADSIVQEGKNVVICGDVNTAHKEIDLARPKANENTSGFLQQERAWIDQLLDHGYVDTFRMFNQEPEQYSYWDQMSRARERNVGWRIDYFFVNRAFADSVKTGFILPDVMGSDHCPVGIEIK